jgi:hypothetical protein
MHIAQKIARAYPRYNVIADPADTHDEGCPINYGCACYCDQHDELSANLQRLQEIGAALDKLLNDQQEQKP